MTPGLVVVTDLDGTIAFGGRPPCRAITAVLEAMAAAREVRLVLATSRSPRSLRTWFGALADQVDLLCCNGALVVGPGRAVERRPLPAELVGAVVGQLRAAGEPFCLEYGDRFVASAADALPWMGRQDRWVLQPAGLPRLDGVLKLSVAHADPWAPRLHALAGAGAEVYPHLTGDADVVAAGVTKARELRRLLGAADASAGTVAAFGNDTNDLELLRAADRAVLVGPGLPGLERLAHVRRIPANEELIASALRNELASAGEAHPLPTIVSQAG